MNNVIDFYEGYDEDNRLKRDNARKIEFTVTTNILNEYIESDFNILELGAGTGAYSFYYAERGNSLLATDLTPKHVDIIKEKAKLKGDEIKLSAEIANATDLSQYKTKSFDVVTCLGPMYHLTEESDRVKCIQEALRVLKPGGILAIAYINKHYVIHVIMAYQRKSFGRTFVDNLLNTGINKEDDENSFLTIGFFTTPIEIENFISGFNVEIIDHAATDGICSLLRDPIDELNDEEYNVWTNYMISSCREKSLLGMSNHGLLVCRKK
ncbi:class I SAM-dependent methyltransferase [Clostridium sp. UBA6640]|uniref:class I SAM-dependent methyltransferase n=1 Tax=Clostridium sp. UBA6640 TaxID=1946370 RepID=UPI0025BE551D|nr:class I SAM-dependent methyltransferase [Clostridium sp. UBA6640]